MILPVAEATISTRPKNAQARARQNRATMLNTIVRPAGDGGVSTISSAAGRKASPSYIDASWLKGPEWEIDWRDPVAASRAHRAEKLLKSRSPKVEPDEPDDDEDDWSKVDWNDTKQAARAHKREQARKAENTQGSHAGENSRQNLPDDWDQGYAQRRINPPPIEP